MTPNRAYYFVVFVKICFFPRFFFGKKSDQFYYSYLADFVGILVLLG